MASTDVAIWTEHETKTIDSSSKPCTMVMYRIVSNKYITGLYVPSILLKSGSIFPAWNDTYQSIGNGLLAGPTTIVNNWQVKGTLQNTNDPTTNRLLLAGTTTQAVSYSGSISSTNYKSTFANFVDTTFSIGPGLQVANITGGLHSSLATDKLAEMTPNDFSTILASNTYNSAVITDNSYNAQNQAFAKSWSGDVVSANTFVIAVSKKAIFSTERWGTGRGITLQNIGIFDGTQCVGINTGVVTNLSSISYTYDGTNSTYTPQNDVGDTSSLKFATSIMPSGGTVGYTTGNAVSCYIQITTNNIASHTINGTYLLKANIVDPINASTNATVQTFTGSSTGILMGLKLENMSLNFTSGYSRPSLTEEAKGAKIKLTWSIGNLNHIYKQTDGSYLTDTTGTDKVVYIENIRRVRTDGYQQPNDTRSQDVLYIGDGSANAISILPEKLWTNNSSDSITDTYGLWFNARYSYYIDAFNVVTGETILNQEHSVTTGPATPINWQEAQVAIESGNPSIQMEWENPLATGTATTIKYTVARTAYGGTGVDVSDNSTTETFTGFTQLSVNNIITTAYSTTTSETLLYGKEFTYTLQANATGNSNTISNVTFSVPDYSSGNSELNYTLDASQNEVGTIIQSSDYLDNSLTYQNNYIVITVPTDYQFTDSSSPTEYQIFEKYKLIATIPKTKVDLSGNKIIFSKYWLNGTNTSMTGAYNTGIFINVIAADPTNGKFSAVGTTKYVKTLAQPKLPYPMPVTNITATDNLLNRITLNWTLPNDSSDTNSPTTYHYISNILIYAIINPNETTDHYDTTETNFDFSTIELPASNTIDGTKYRLITTQGVVTSYTHTNLWDNEIVGYRIVTTNSQGLFSGQDPNNPTSGNILWGTTQTDISGSTYREPIVNYLDLYTFDNTHVQAKTSGPVAATQVTLAGTAQVNSIPVTWTLPAASTYSTDTPLTYSAHYNYTSVLAGAILTPANSVLIPAPVVTATSVTSSTNVSLTGLVPGSTYTVYTTVYTNMQETHAAAINWQAGTDVSRNYTTSTVTPNKYLVMDPLEYTMSLDSTTSIQWQLKSYASITHEYNGDILNAPDFMYPEWRKYSVNPAADPCVIYINEDAFNTGGISITNGDVIAIFGKDSGGRCLECKAWTGLALQMTLSLETDTGRNDGIVNSENELYFLLWNSTTLKITPLYVSGLVKRDGNNDAVSTPSTISYIKQISGSYTITSFAIPNYNYRIYKAGVFLQEVIDIIPSDNNYTYTINDGQASDYDVNWYVSTINTSYSGTYVPNITNQSPIWIAPPAQAIVKQPDVITINNPIKTNVTYSDTTGSSPDLVLGNSGTQTITFNSRSYKFISFNIVDPSYVTIGDLFDQVIASGSETITKILVINEAAKQYEKVGSTWGADYTDPINYDKAYYVNIITSNDVNSTLTITGKQVRGINLGFTIGWNFMGPTTVYNPEDAYTILHKTIVNDSTTTFWSQLLIMFDKNGTFILGGATGATYSMGSMNFTPGDGFIVNVQMGLIVLLGSLAAIRNKGDFTADKNVTTDDYIALADYLVQINPNYKTITTDIATEAASSNFFANIKSLNNTSVGLNDLVYLISYVNNPSIGFPEEGDK